MLWQKKVGYATLLHTLNRYIHVHLYSPVALINYNCKPLERCEYDAYGNCHVLEPNYTEKPDGISDFDILDNGSLKLQYNRNRYYDQYTGRWLTHDPLGITPNSPWPNRFGGIHQYDDGLNVYEAAASNPVITVDPWGLAGLFPWPRPVPRGRGAAPLRAIDCPDGGCPTGWLDPLPSSGLTQDWHVSNAVTNYVADLGDREFSHRSHFAHRLAARRGFYEWTKNVEPELISRGKYLGYGLYPCTCTCFDYSHSGVSKWGWAIDEHDGIDNWAGIINVCWGPTDEYCDLAYSASCCVKRNCADGKFVGELVCRVRFDMKDKFSFDVSGWPPAKRFGVPFWHIIHCDKTLDVTIPLF